MGRHTNVIQEAPGAGAMGSRHSFCARLYGQRRAKRKTETIVEHLKQAEKEGRDETGRTTSHSQK